MLFRPATETQITHGRRLWLYVLGGLVVLFLILPSLLIIPLSFSDSRYLAFPPPGWSTRWYEAYFGAVEWRDATRVSLVAATLTMIVSTALGTLAAYSLHASQSRFMQIVYATFMLPLIIPGILIAIGIFLLFARIGLVNSMAGIVLAHSVMAIPLVVITVASGLKSYDMAQEMVARSLGASRPWAFLTVTLPQIKISVVSGALLAFITSLDEVVISLFIAGGENSTLTRRMFNALRDEIDPTIAAISTLLILLSVALLGLTQMLQRAPRERPSPVEDSTSRNASSRPPR
jgi:putative spermidine/putrescine transport system permease protein